MTAFSEQLLQELLLAKEVVTEEQWQELLAQRDRTLDGNTLLSLDPSRYELQVQVVGGDTTRIALPVERGAKPAYQAANWVPSAPGEALVISALGQVVGELRGITGLMLGKGPPVLYGPGMADWKWWAQTPTLAARQVPLQPESHFPLDLQVAPGNHAVIVTDRGAGTLHWVDLKKRRVAHSLNLRPPGDRRGLSVAVAAGGKRIYVTDNQTPTLWVLDSRFRPKRHPIPHGIAGNLCLSEDGQWLYLLALKPGNQLELLAMDATNLLLKQSIPLQGEPFSRLDDPCDLLALSPQGDFLAVMSAWHKPSLLTPMLSLIDTQTLEMIDQRLLVEEDKPAHLAWLTPKPTVSLLDLIMEKGYASLELLQDWMAEMPPPTVLLPISASEFPTLDRFQVDPTILGAFPDKVLRSYQFLPLNQEDDVLTVAVVEGVEEKLRAMFSDRLADVSLEMVPIPQLEFERFLQERYPIIVETMARIAQRHQESQAAAAAPSPPPPARANLDPSVPPQPALREELQEWDADMVVQTLVEYLVEGFYRQTDCDLRTEEEALVKLFAACEEARHQLIFYDRTTIDIPDLHRGMPLTATLTQDILLELISALPRGGTLAGKTLASPDPFAYLSEGHLLLCDPVAKRVIEVNTNGQVVFEVEADAPRWASRLANGNTLVVDGNRIVEYTKSGSVHWTLEEAGRRSDLKVLQPSKALRLMNGHTLVADTGQHRVFEVDEKGKVIWQFGFTGSLGLSEGRLYAPHDVQRLPNGHHLIADSDNHRVVELDPNGRVVWQHGNPQNKLGSGQGTGNQLLDTPVAAYRLESGNTLITDSGNSRALEVTPDHQVVWVYHLQERPVTAWRWIDGTTLVIGTTVLARVTPKGEALWVIPMQELKPAPPAQLRAEPESPAGPSRAERLARQVAEGYLKARDLLELDVILVDRHRNRLFQINRQKRIVWRMGEDDSPLALRLERPQRVEPAGEGRLLITDTDHHRVIEVFTATKESVWQYGVTGAMGSGPGQLGHPRSATLTPEGTVLIADGYSGRVIEVNREGEVVWTFGGWDASANLLTSPYYAQRLLDGNTLITDWSGHTVIEVDPDGHLIWQYGKPRQPGSGEGQLMYPEMAIRLDNANTLIADTRNSRVLEVDPEGNVVWSYGGIHPTEQKRALSNPIRVQRLDDGHTVIVHNGYRQVVEVNPLGDVLWHYSLPSGR